MVTSMEHQNYEGEEFPILTTLYKMNFQLNIELPRQLTFNNLILS